MSIIRSYEDGYLAAPEELPDGSFRIAERNCAIFAVAREHPLACSTELEFLRLPPCPRPRSNG